MKTIALQLAASFFGALGFSFLFNVEKKNLLPCSFGGILVWAVYLLANETFLLGVFLSAAISAAACQLFAEMMARLLRAPTVTFCIPALVPLIPGGSLYRTMDGVISQNWDMFRFYGASTLKVALGIAVGLSFVSGTFYLFFQSRQKQKQK